MSNRIIQTGCIPLIPDPQVALKAGQIFTTSREQTEQVIALGMAYLDLWSNIKNSFRGLADAVDRAVQIRNLSAMSDKSLSDIGIRRDQLPQFYVENNLESVNGGRGPRWRGEGER